uniref:50S ribosomal protein L12 n=1 Tax=Ascoseira mirabilis TaxID=76830 RepID=UPI00300208F2|nr:50S ribosomal protein L12 [Ascoseira mirabilis]
MVLRILTVIDKVQDLSLLEATELVKALENLFNVDASIGGGVMMMNPDQNTSEDKNPVEKQTEFNVSLDQVPPEKKISILKVVRSITELGLKEAKEVVENTPQIIKEGLNIDTAEETKKLLESAGAIVTLV